MKKNFFVVFFTFILIVISGCSSDQAQANGSGPPPDAADNPLPVLQNLEPGAVLLNSPDFILTAIGSDFKNNSKIIIDGKEMATTYVSSGELSCEIKSGMTVSALFGYGKSSRADPQAGSWSVVVRTPSPGGGDSAARTFRLRDYPDFSQPETISSGFAESYGNGLSIDGEDRIFLYFVDNDSDPFDEDDYANIQIYYTDDAGDYWQGPVDASLTGCPDSPYMTCSSDNTLWMCFHGNPTAGNNFSNSILVKKSVTRGSSWGGGSRANPPEHSLVYQEDGTLPKMSVGADNVLHLVYERTLLNEWTSSYYLRSANNGGSWDVMEIGSHEMSLEPMVASAGDNTYIVYGEHNPWVASLRYRCNVYFMRSQNNGLSWRSRKRLSPDLGYSGNGFRIAAGPAGRVAAAWVKNSVRFISSDDYGASWKPIKTFGLVKGHASMVYDSLGNLLLVWSGIDGIKFRRSINNGVSWSAIVTVVSGTDFKLARVAVSSQGTIIISWNVNDRRIECCRSVFN